jgi:putative restriction endonuclease
VRDEIVLAYELYCTLPPSKNRVDNPQVMALSEVIGHSAGSVKAMLENFKSFDPNYVKDNKVGLRHGSKMTGEVAAEFMGNWDACVWETKRIKHEFVTSSYMST